MFISSELTVLSGAISEGTLSGKTLKLASDLEADKSARLKSNLSIHGKENNSNIRLVKQ